jgi:hypothetical protein
VAVIPAAEVCAQPVVDDLVQLLQRVKHLPGCVTTLATQRDAGAVARPRGLRRRRMGMLNPSGHTGNLVWSRRRVAGAADAVARPWPRPIGP